MTTTYDPSDPGTLRDPYPLFAELRAAGGVQWCPALSGWLALDGASVQAVVTTPAVFSADRLVPVHGRLQEPDRTTAGEVMRWLSLWMVFQDPPNHTRLRRHLVNVINPRMVESLRASTTEIVTDLLDALPSDQPFDFYSQVGLTLPGYVVMDLLGVPRDRLPEVKQWSDEMMLFIGSSRGIEDKYAKAKHGAESMAGLFRELIAERRAHPQDDVLTRMITSEVKGETLTEDELIACMMMIANGAQETTAHLLSNALLGLEAHPETRAKLLGDLDGLIVTAVDEFLRYDSPVLSTARLLVADADLGGAAMRSGDRVFAVLASANRDPEVFEHPDEIALEGHPAGHLAFSKGVHFCLGAPVARLEAQILLTELLRRFPDVHLAEAVDRIPWVNSMVARGPQHLPLLLT